LIWNKRIFKNRIFSRTKYSNSKYSNICFEIFEYSKFFFARFCQFFQGNSTWPNIFLSIDCLTFVFLAIFQRIITFSKKKIKKNSASMRQKTIKVKKIQNLLTSVFNVGWRRIFLEIFEKKKNNKNIWFCTKYSNVAPNNQKVQYLFFQIFEYCKIFEYFFAKYSNIFLLDIRIFYKTNSCSEPLAPCMNCLDTVEQK
jgi:hypothetical protein